MDRHVQPLLWTGERHAHLRLTDAIVPGQRQRRPRGFARPPRYPDRHAHGTELWQQSLRAVTSHRGRPPVLGVDPELVLVLELNRQLDPDRVRPAGLSMLEFAGERVLVTFASDPELTQFLRIIEKYQQGVRSPREEGGPERAAAYEELIDAIDVVRRWAIDDVISDELQGVLARVTPEQVLRLDVQCWCPDDPTEARRRYHEVGQAVSAAGGTVHDQSLRHHAGLSMLRVELPAAEVRPLARVDRIKSIDVLPRPPSRIPRSGVPARTASRPFCRRRQAPPPLRSSTPAYGRLTHCSRRLSSALRRSAPGSLTAGTRMATARSSRASPCTGSWRSTSPLRRRCGRRDDC